MPTKAPSERSRVRRVPKRADYDRATVHAILDAARVAHVAVATDDGPVAVPTLCARRGDELLLHGSSASRLYRARAAGAPACASVALVDGLVLARSAFHHSVNYRSVVVHGRARPISEPEEKAAALQAFVERLAPGRWPEIRGPSPQELKATAVVALPLDESAAKVRTGGPVDEPEDMALEVWAGVVPLQEVEGTPIRDDSGAPAA